MTNSTHVPVVIDHLAGSWGVGAAKQIDYPIETTDLHGRRVVVARVPFGSRVNAHDIAHLIAATPDLVRSLQTAIWRLDDMLKGDDGQAWKEAEKAMPGLRSVLSQATLGRLA